MADLLSSGNDEIDFDRAASAFPDISLDGDGDIPSGPIIPTATNSNFDGGFDLGDFDSAPVRDVKVTGYEDGEIEKFESEFPDIGVPEVRVCAKQTERSVGMQPSGGSPFALFTAYIWRDPALCTASTALGALLDANFDTAHRGR